MKPALPAAHCRAGGAIQAVGQDAELQHRPGYAQFRPGEAGEQGEPGHDLRHDDG
jgi:hypothetical protein